MKNFAFNTYLESRSLIAKNDRAYRGMIRWVSAFRPKQANLIVSADADIVIEGFPRSANTFMTTWFDLAQEKNTKIAHHLHESYQVRFAEANDIPCVVLIRRPLDAIASVILRDRRMKSVSMLRNYIRFYDQIQSYHRNSVIVMFEEAIHQPNSVIEKINKRYDTAFDCLPEDRRKDVSHLIETKHLENFSLDKVDPLKIASPTTEKERAKEIIAADIARHGKLLTACNAIYERVVALR